MGGAFSEPSTLVDATHKYKLCEVERLLDSGCNINQVDQVRHLHAVLPSLDFTSLCLQHGFTALIVAARNNNTRIARFLIDKGADLNARGHVRTSLHLLHFTYHCTLLHIT